MWQFSYIELGIALANEGSEYYTQTIYWSKDGLFAYFAPYPRDYDSLGTNYGNGVALLRVNLKNGQIQTILPDINRFYSISFSPTGRRIAYVSLNSDKPLNLILHDLQSGESKQVELEQEYDQAGEFVWSSDGLKLAYKLIVTGNECSRKLAIRLLNIETMSSETILGNTQVYTCQESDPTYYVRAVTNNYAILEQHGDIWVYSFDRQQLLLQATATPQP